VLHAKLRNRTCQGLDWQGQGQGPSLQGPGQGQGLDLQGQGQGLKFGPKESLRTRINITALCWVGIMRERNGHHEFWHNLFVQCREAEGE